MNKTLQIILLFGLITSTHLATSQIIIKRDTVKTTKGSIIKETVTDVVTQTDNMYEEMPKFDTYVKAHLKHIPGVHGLVTVSFTNEKDGTLTNVKIVKGLGKAANQEALRVVRSYPHWEPDTMAGRPLKTQILTSIVFK